MSSSNKNEEQNNQLTDQESNQGVQSEQSQYTSGNEEYMNEGSSRFEEYYDEILEDNPSEDRKKSFLVGLFDIIENFRLDSFKKNTKQKREDRKEKKTKEKELKESSMTIDDVKDQRKKLVKSFGLRLFLFGFAMILISGAIIFALQDNEKKDRPRINTKTLLNDTTSFGGIDQKDYFLEQNILDDKINSVEKQAKTEREKLTNKVDEQTKVITDHIDSSVKALEERQTEKLENTKKDILTTVDEKIGEVSEKQQNQAKELEARVKQYSDKAQLKLVDGKLIFPGQENTKNGKPIVLDPATRLSADGTDIKTEKVEKVEEYILDLGNEQVEEMAFDTGMKPPADKNKTKEIEFDLTTSLVRVTLVNGIKAATLDIGLNQPSPVLMTIEGVKYSANDHSDSILKGCFLRGVGIGNINTSRVEIFGTHLSCIIEAESGDLYKIEHDFPKNQVWIKGEDGADGVAGEIVDSSGKLLSKAAAMSFLEGLSNYFSAQNLVTGGTATLGTNTGTVAQLGTSMQSGFGTGMQTSFDLIIQQYEKILNGYYPFIDVKGGRKNLTAVFGGKVKLKAVPYKEADFENY